MKQSGNTILITGGASGIGLAFAERFVKTGNDVIICGRREAKLAEAKERIPSLHTRVCDVSDAEQRQSLVTWATKTFPNLNVLVNNAGIQQRLNLTKPAQEWSYLHQEIAANLDAPIHLTVLFLEHLMRQPDAAIVNVSSGLAITPAAFAPIYSATKAALHSFSMSLRLQVEGTNVDVIEVLPPAVNTDLGGVGLHTFGAPVDDFADAIFAGFEAGKKEIGYGGTDERLQASKSGIEQAMQHMWSNYRKNNSSF